MNDSKLKKLNRLLKNGILSFLVLGILSGLNVINFYFYPSENMVSVVSELLLGFLSILSFIVSILLVISYYSIKIIFSDFDTNISATTVSSAKYKPSLIEVNALKGTHK